MNQRFRATSPLRLACAAAAFGLLAALPAHAQERAAAPASGQQAGRHEDGKRQRPPELVLQAQAVAELPQDTVTITLAAERDGADQAGVGKALTAVLDEAMKQAKGDGKVSARNGSYRIWAVTNRDGQLTGWRGRVEMVLESRDFPAASALAGKLSETMPVAGIAFSLSEQARAEQERRLLEQAAQAFGERAQAAAAAFGFDGYRIRKIELGGSGAQYVRPRMQAMAASAESVSMKLADVPLQADTEMVTVSVNGTVSLH
ncbi:SIMPL domain-containing protein [Orrella sp. JC864]|uniref:SIMPL domain-containing protein n=1 Tax=Orrella sp. JC864 TaxID=3120298 RepID=UPI00300955D8